MDEVRYRPRRDGVGFKIEDTQNNTFLEDEEYDDFFVANQEAERREEREAAEELARKVKASSPEIAAELRRGVPPNVLLWRLRERGEGESEVALVLAGRKQPRSMRPRRYGSPHWAWPGIQIDTQLIGRHAKT
jgi:hypothetical protein